MQITVKAYVSDAVAMLNDVHKRHIPFASYYAATLTARDVKAREVSVMKQVFDRPTPYALNALRVKPATKSDPVASVEFKEFGGGVPAKRFMNPNIHGGGRSQKSHEKLLAGLTGSTYLVPGKAVVLDSYGNMKGSELRRIISQLGASRNPDANASGSARSKRKRKSDAYFVTKRGAIMHRKGTEVKVALLPVRAPQYTKRFPFYEEANQVVAARYPANFITALERAISTSNYKGKWK